MDIIKKIKNYTINERHCLGEGSFGKVYEAISDEGRKVAIKRVEQKIICSDKYLKESLDNEIAIMQKFKHPNIVQLYEVIPTQNNIYLVMQYCSGGDLKRFCMTRKINEETAFNILRQISKGFEELTKYNIIHRDLKAANILVHNQTFKICDFGFAKFFSQTGKMARTCVGTPIYMSPQVLKHKNYTSKTDVWSLGILFFELLFGRLPFTGYNEQDLYRNILKEPLKIPQCSKQAAKILQNTLVIEEASRWGWAEVFENVLNKPVAIQRFRGNTPKQGLFYKQQNNTSSEEKLDKRVYQQILLNQPALKMPVNNYFSDEIGYEQVEKVRQQFAKKPRNILAVQNQGEQIRQIQPVQIIQQQNIIQQRQPQQNARFFYFILVQFIVSPIQGSLSFDSFLFTLWKYTKQLYERLLEKPEISNMQLYRNILLIELNEIKGLEVELKVKKEGNLRKLGDIVYQQSKNIVANKKKIVWLKRFLDKKYTYDCID